MKKMFAGIIIGILLTVSVNAAVQYTLTESPWKIVVDGQVVQDEKLPMLLMEPGYNYAPVAVFREICGKIGLGFEANAESKEVRITTKQEVKKVSTTNITPTPPLAVEYKEPYTIEYNGKRLAFLGDINDMLKPLGYEIAASNKSDGLLWLRCNGAPVIKDIACYWNKHPDHKQGVAYIEYDFYVENIEPLIKK